MDAVAKSIFIIFEKSWRTGGVGGRPAILPSSKRTRRTPGKLRVNHLHPWKSDETDHSGGHHKHVEEKMVRNCHHGFTKRNYA